MEAEVRRMRTSSQGELFVRGGQGKEKEEDVYCISMYVYFTCVHEKGMY